VLLRDALVRAWSQGATQPSSFLSCALDHQVRLVVTAEHLGDEASRLDAVGVFGDPCERVDEACDLLGIGDGKRLGCRHARRDALPRSRLTGSGTLLEPRTVFELGNAEPANDRTQGQTALEVDGGANRLVVTVDPPVPVLRPRRLRRARRWTINDANDG
jgi:hypothetical protein